MTHPPPTTSPQPFIHEAHAFDWIKLHHRPIITAVVAGFLAVVAVRWWVDRVRSRRRFARARVSEPIAQALGNCPVTVKKSRLRDGSVTYMRLAYPAGARDHAGNNHIANLSAILEERMGGPVAIDWGKKHGIVTVQLARPEKVEEQAPTGLVERAQKVAHQLLGPESRVVNFVPQINGKAQEFTVTHTSIKDTTPAFRAEVDAHMQAKLGQKLYSQWDTLNDTVTWRAVPDLPSRLMHPAIAAADNHIIPFGVDANGKTVAWDLDSDVPHCMVAGPTGSGKSSTILTIAARASWFADIRLCDYKRLTARSLKNWPGVTRMARDLDDIADLLISAEREMMDRIVDLDTGKVDEDDLQPIIIIMEEGPVTIVKLEELHRRSGGEDGKPGKGPAPAKLSFDNLTLLGRQPRVHLCVAFQRPNADIIGGIIRDQFGCRVLLGKPKRGTREMMELDTAITTGPRGRGVADTGAGAREFQAWFTPDPARYDKLPADQRAIIDGLRPVAIHPKPTDSNHPSNGMNPYIYHEPEPIAPLLPFVPRIVEAEPEPVAPTVKRCSKCQTDRDLAEFSADKQRPDGKRRWCRACDKARRTVAEKMPDDQRV